MSLADPTSPISAVAHRAGVGIGAFYHRYASKEDLLRTLCRNGQEIYLAEIRQALASDAGPWEAFTTFLCRIVAADTSGLTVRLAGTFVPTDEQMVPARASCWSQARRRRPHRRTPPAPPGRHHRRFALWPAHALPGQPPTWQEQTERWLAR